jgi:predicted anti-sigma-YlaC factor YlaD
VTTCRFAFDDGVYILGALAPGERAEYERHLPACQSCRHSVARLAVLPGLLGRLDPERALTEVEVPATSLPRTLLAAATQRRAERTRRRWFAVGAGAVAAMLAAVVGVGVHLADMRANTGPPVAMTSMRSATGTTLPVSAEVGLVPIAGGTRVEMKCRYTDSDEGHVWTVRLVVIPSTGIGMEQIGSWVARDGEELTVDGVTHLTPAQIGRVELRTDNYRALLVWTPG